MTGLFINGIGIGQDPESFDRDLIYQNNINKIGNSKEQIIVINNFLAKDVCDKIINQIQSIKLKGNGKFWDEMMYYDENVQEKINEYIPIIINTINQKYNINVIKTGKTHVIKWVAGKSMDMHVDDLSEYTPHHHISSIIYLNDNYDGGEINFPIHKILIKPKIGDLLIFPGNYNFPHEVKKIINGTRYTIPIWFKYK